MPSQLHQPAVCLQTSARVCFVELSPRCRDREWASSFGDVQRALRARPAGELVLDLTKSRWIDPNPLLGIALELEFWRSRAGATTILLPDPAQTPQGSQDQADFLHWLFAEGFLSCLLGIPLRPTSPSLSPAATIRVGNENISTLASLEALLDRTSPVYTIPVVPALPARIIDLSTVTDIPSLVERLLNEAREHGLRRHFDRDVYSNAYRQAVALSPEEMSSTGFVEELRQILLELIENVKLHAYPSESFPSSPHPVALFARFRHGLNDARVSHLRSMLRLQHREEREHCPRLVAADEVAQLGSIEIFVADGGIGLSTHLAKTLSRSPSRKHPLRSFFVRLVARPIEIGIYLR